MVTCREVHPEYKCMECGHHQDDHFRGTRMEIGNCRVCNCEKYIHPFADNRSSLEKQGYNRPRPWVG